MIDKSNMYTFQDTFKLLIDNISLIINNIVDIISTILNYIYDHYVTVRHNIRDKIKNVLLLITNPNKDKQNKLIFDLMDTERFPSIILTNSDILIDNNDNNDNDNKKKNNNEIEDSVSLDDKLFDQPEDIFINGISIDEQNVNEYVFHERKSKDDYVIINDYF